ncbi:MAG: tetratricopeptide repeat protein [Planctomycetaceae bacterium]|nr:tetratricopeptide repeat protein [Planctomycetaceae bacterium]
MKYNAASAILCLFATVLLASFAENLQAAPADDEYTLGLTLYGQKRWALATETFETYLNKYPTHKNVPLAKLYLAQGYVNQQDYKQARVVLRDFLKNHPKSKNQAQAMYRVAECSYFLDDFLAAIKDFRKFAKASPKDPLTEWALPYLADSYLRIGKAEQAEIVFRESLDKFPQGRFVEDSRFGLARSLELLNRSQDAITQYQNLVTFPAGKRIPESMFNLGMLYFQQVNYAKAAEIFEKLTQKYPDHVLIPLAKLNTGYAYYSLKKWDLAKQNFEAASNTAAYQNTARFWLAQTYKSQNNYAEAEKILLSLNKDKPDETLKPRIKYQLAESQLQLDKHDLALQGFLDYLKQWPQEESAGNAYVHAVEICLLNNQLGQGWGLAEKAIAAKLSSEQQREVKLLQARLLTRKESLSNPLPDSLKDQKIRIKQADEILSELLKETDQLDSDQLNQQVRYHSARTKMEQKDFPEAIKILVPMTTSRPQQKILLIPDAWLLLAKCQYEAQEFQAAIDASKKLLELNPGNTVAEQGLVVQLNSMTELGQSDQAELILESLKKLQLPTEKMAQLMYQLADAAYAKKNWIGAEKLYRLLLSLEPDQQWKIKGLSAIGWTQYEAARFEESAETFRSLREQFPDSKQATADAGFMRGMASLQAEQVKQAAEVFLETAQAFRSTPQEKVGSPVHLIAYRSAREAARAFRKLDLVEKSALAYQLAYEELSKQPEKKRQHLDKLLDEWALLYYEADQFDQADRIFELLVKETPLSDRADDAMLSLAESQFIAGKTEQARTSLEKLVANKQTDEYVTRRALYQLVMITSEQKDQAAVKKFAEAYLKTIDTQKVDISELGEVESQLIQLHLDENQLKEARQRLDLLLKRAEGFEENQAADLLPRTYVFSAELARREKKYEQAHKALTAVQKQFPDCDELAQLEVIVGRTYIAQAKFDDALKMFRSVLSRSGSKKNLAAAQSQFYIAETILMQKEYSQAVKEYIRMAVLFPGFPDLQSAAMYQAGQCDEVLGNVEQAIDSYNELIRVFPKSEFAPKAKKRIEELAPATTNK